MTIYHVVYWDFNGIECVDSTHTTKEKAQNRIDYLIKECVYSYFRKEFEIHPEEIQ